MQTDWGVGINFVLEQEGGYVNDPNDPGGETRYGISKKSFPDLDIKNLTIQQAKEIYRIYYWTPCKCDELPTMFAIALFDSAVNQGVGTAIRIMQRAVSVKDDGVIGPITLSAVRNAKPRARTLMLARRMEAYCKLMAEKPNLLVYALNWSHRVISLAKLVL